MLVRIVNQLEEVQIGVLHRNLRQKKLVSRALDEVDELDSTAVPHNSKHAIELRPRNHLDAHGQVGWANAPNLSLLA